MTKPKKDNEGEQQPKLFSSKYIVGLVAMIIILIVTFKLLPTDYTWPEIKEILLSAKPGYIIAGFGLMFIFQHCVTLSIQLLINLFSGQRFPLELSFKSAYIGYFFNNVTPFATGGQPMQMYYMNKRGVSLSYSSIIFMLLSIFYTICLLTVGAVMLIWKHDLIMSSLHYIRYFMYVGYLLNSLLIVGMVLLIVKPAIIRSLAKGVSGLLLRFRFIKNPYHYLRKLANFTRGYKANSDALRKKPIVLVKLFLLHLIQILVLFTIPYLATRSLGGKPNMLADTVSLQASLYISANSIPTPGAVGITETGFVTMFKSILPDHQVMPAMLLTRFINLYGFMIISAIITIIAFLRADHDRKHKKPRLDKKTKLLKNKANNRV